MKAQFIYENVSPYKKGDKTIRNDGKGHYYIQKVEDHSKKYDLLKVDDKKYVASDWMEANTTLIPNIKTRKTRSDKGYTIGSTMTKSQYEKMCKGAVEDIVSSIPEPKYHTDEDEYNEHSMIYDSAESMIYDESIFNYLHRRYVRNYQSQPSRKELIEILASDMENYLS